MIPIAHSGHWLINVLYMLPVVIALGVLGWQKFRRNADDPGRATPDTAAAQAARQKDPLDER